MATQYQCTFAVGRPQQTEAAHVQRFGHRIVPLTVLTVTVTRANVRVDERRRWRRRGRMLMNRSSR